jgi:hypothetical protein
LDSTKTFAILLLVSISVFVTEVMAGNAEYGFVATDGAMVYAKPSFDAKVISYLRKGNKVIVSKKIQGAFRRISVKKGTIGFISETDVIVKPSAKDAKHAKRNHRQKPVSETRFVGIVGGVVNYKESIGSEEPASNEPIYGMRISGPNLLMSGPMIWELNLLMHMGAPKYYNGVSDITPSGFFMLMDMPMLVPIMDHMNSMGYIGLGPHLDYSHFNVIYQKVAYNLEELRIGAVFVLGGGFRMGSIMTRLDYKYYWDSEKYSALQLGILTEF